jgi:hypothetical protein
MILMLIYQKLYLVLLKERISNPIEIDGLGYFAVKIIEIIPAKIEIIR